MFISGSPKPTLPTAKDYEPPAPASQRDLGPPPPGYGRFNDFERAGPNGPSPGFAGNNFQGTSRRNLDEVLCFKVSHGGLLQHSHFALT